MPKTSKIYHVFASDGSGPQHPQGAWCSHCGETLDITPMLPLRVEIYIAMLRAFCECHEDCPKPEGV